MLKKQRYEAFISHFSENMPIAETELQYENPFQLLVAVVLSAQCTDKRVNIVTRTLFEHFPTPAHLAATHFDELFPYIRSISYPNNKTKHLIGLGKMLMEEFGGEVPSTVDELTKLPGVGRKTANVITSVVWNQPNMAVDTHVFRVSRRLGLVPLTAKTPYDVEKQLVKHIPKQYIHVAHHWLILHGRYTCLARRPKCEECTITHFCKYFEKANKIAAKEGVQK
ncbi:DNA-(apurinic or apyrimidinic site) lyase /endonuclease III [Algoriphagus alkaliphilus]|jgi:endonuclease-3|uniref:Endonuclease III n=1 Tax=Algoriphagus alkaliphilus TaxID=279824 RepID=A0A1G5UWX9_9BACT|nr:MULTISPECIES: endonuclease III [Algoriphagus]MBA4300765.1 endonuclease III [Cyclobacterium sp.]MDO8968924.1 endonuclease III [Algoriphagus sp.]MDP2041362.1 endonuclease III [Algoriphagus sp.]MDP3202078.1 endonuclease III [Algoriphagus sp.]MDP3471242.1 endonuclease III [Algoriphagus sp.]